jgi:hypothetical protein
MRCRKGLDLRSRGHQHTTRADLGNATQLTSQLLFFVQKYAFSGVIESKTALIAS